MPLPPVVALVLAVVVLSTAAATAPANVARVLFLGDSLTSCNGVSRDFTRAQLSYRRPLWATALQEGWAPCMEWVGTRGGCNARLDAHLDAPALFPQRHDSYFGRSLAAALAQLTAVIDEEPDVVVVCLGINDLILQHWELADPTKHPDGLRRVTEAMLPLYRSLFSRLLGGGAASRRLVVVTLPPLSGKGVRAKQVRRGLRLLPAADAALASAIAGLEAAARDRVAVANLTDAAFDGRTMVYDGLHPNDAGEACIAATVRPALRAAVRAVVGKVRCAGA